MPFSFRKLTSRFEKAQPKRRKKPKLKKPDPPKRQNTFGAFGVLRRSPQKNVRVCFTNRGFGKIVKSVRSLTPNAPDKKTVVNIAKILEDVKIEKEPATSFKSIPEFVGIDYVGYIIDKERLDRTTGQWMRIDEYKIIGGQANSFKDSRVAYGNCYRYRIKSIIKVTMSIIKESFETFELTENVRRLERDKIKEELRVKQDIVANISRVANRGLFGKSSRGKPSISFDLFKNLKIRANERKTEPVRVSANKIRDIRKFRQIKKLRVRDLDIARGTISSNNLQKQINKTITKLKERNVEHMSFYYESEPSKTWQYEEIVENVPPPPPSSIKIIPSSLKEEICLSWLKPANSQRDIKFYRVYKRRRVGLRWSLLATLPESENFYLDTNVRFNRKYIYALSCIDAHGLESFLSIQTEAQLNPNYIAEGRERPLKWISGSGVQPEEIEVVLKKFQDTEDPIIARRNFVIRPTNEMNEAEKKLLIRVTSLDTHEKKEFHLTLKNVNLLDDDPDE